MVRQDMPHLDQGDHRIMAHHYDITALCAPTAAANGLLWLAKNGHENLKFDKPYNLVAELANRAGTVGGGGGTDFRVLSREIVKLVRESGCQCECQYMGSRWSRLDGGRFEFTPIDMTLLRKSLLDKNKIALIQIDACHYNKAEKAYISTSGHLITLAGYDDEKGCLVVADPNEGHSLQYCPFGLLENQDGIVTIDRIPVCKALGVYGLSRKNSVMTDVITAAAIFTVN
jgi:hypothetical protein